MVFNILPIPLPYLEAKYSQTYRKYAVLNIYKANIFHTPTLRKKQETQKYYKGHRK